MTEEVLYKNQSHAVLVWFMASPFLFAGVWILFTKFFYLPILVVLIIIYAFRKRYFNLVIFNDRIVLKSLLWNKEKNFADVLGLKIHEASVEDPGRSVVIRFKSGESVAFSPRNKQDALLLVRIFEKNNLPIVLNDQLKNLKAWGVKQPMEDGAW